MYASIEHNTVCFNKDVHLCVTIEYLYLFCTWHTNAKCFFAMCILVFSSTTIGQLYFITKMPTFGFYEYKVEGSGCGFNRKRGLAETDP